MPQALVVAVVGVGLYIGYRVIAGLAGQATREGEALARQHAAARRPLEKNLGRLEFDPRTGVYRPVDRQD